MLQIIVDCYFVSCPKPFRGQQWLATWSLFNHLLNHTQRMLTLHTGSTADKLKLHTGSTADKRSNSLKAMALSGLLHYNEGPVHLSILYVN